MLGVVMAKKYKTKKKEVVCVKCGHRWQRRKETLPKKCPKCGSTLYQGGEPKKPGPHKVEIDKSLFEGLCRIHCTQGEICDFFGIDDKTMCRWVRDEYGAEFSEIYAQKRAPGKVSLRRQLARQSENVPSIAIFLAKNWLGMSDQHNVNVGLNREAVDAVLSVLPDEYAEAIKKSLAEKGKK